MQTSIATMVFGTGHAGVLKSNRGEGMHLSDSWWPPVALFLDQLER
ncbi:hypothetical protein QF038_004119 [Pseudarthrobacter sp. W1I19]|nr:hypothetical protein [Pseudarthrobacter sp. W1I19]